MYKVFALFLYFVCFSSLSQTLNIGASEWEDFTHRDGSGIYLNLIKSIYPDVKLSIKIDSYNRILHQFNENKLDMVIGVYRGHVKKGILPNWYLDTENPIIAIYDPKHTKLENSSDLQSLTSAWIRGYQFERFIPEIDAPYRINSIKDGFKLLENSRIDVLIDYAYNLTGSNNNKYKSLELTPSQHIYVAFQRNKNGKDLAERWDRAMLKLRENGELQRIYGKYYLNSGLSKFNSKKENVIIITQNANLLNQLNYENRPSIESKVLNLVIDRLNDHQLEPKVLRTYLDIDKYRDIPKACFSNMLKNKAREEHFIFSNPMAMYLGLRLYSNSKLTSQKPIDLLELMSSNPGKQLGISPGQSYGVYLDGQIIKIKPDQIISIPAKTTTSLKALEVGHLSFLLGYPTVIERGLEQTGAKNIYSYPLAGVKAMTLSHMMCSRTAESMKFISEFNKVISWLYRNDEYVNSLSDDISQGEKANYINELESLISNSGN